MAKCKITQVRSKIGSTKKQRATLTAIGLRKINHSVEREKTPCLLGQIAKVSHLIKVEEIDE
jgi:large subunit ribosomal protein L30